MLARAVDEATQIPFLKAAAGALVLLDPTLRWLALFGFVTTLEQQIFEEGGGNARGSASNINKDWNGVWDAAARRTSDGWVAEMAIPMVTLRSPDVPVQTWLHAKSLRMSLEELVGKLADKALFDSKTVKLTPFSTGTGSEPFG